MFNLPFWHYGSHGKFKKYCYDIANDYDFYK